MHRIYFSNILYDEKDNALLIAQSEQYRTLVYLIFVFKKDDNNNWELFSYRFFIKG